ncbi:MAG: hypothetical protein LDLANPLL_01990 [Turneriella sp.]|nr:hypothetical protein [Turneriella sp.]
MVFADPPYFLSNNGLSIQSGKIVSVNKGAWDKSQGGSSTTGISANLVNRRFVGIDQDKDFLEMSIKRKQDIENKNTVELYRKKIWVMSH